MSGRGRLDDFFSPERLRRAWSDAPRPEAPPEPSPPLVAEPPAPAPPEPPALEALQAEVRARYPAGHAVHKLTEDLVQRLAEGDRAGALGVLADLESLAELTLRTGGRR